MTEVTKKEEFIVNEDDLKMENIPKDIGNGLHLRLYSAKLGKLKQFCYWYNYQLNCLH